jgi:hypothetical protein
LPGYILNGTVPYISFFKYIVKICTNFMIRNQCFLLRIL